MGIIFIISVVSPPLFEMHFHWKTSAHGCKNARVRNRFESAILNYIHNYEKKIHGESDYSIWSISVQYILHWNYMPKDVYCVTFKWEVSMKGGQDTRLRYAYLQVKGKCIKGNFYLI